MDRRLRVRGLRHVVSSRRSGLELLARESRTRRRMRPQHFVRLKAQRRRTDSPGDFAPGLDGVGVRRSGSLDFQARRALSSPRENQPARRCPRMTDPSPSLARIALLFLTRAELLHEQRWLDFLAGHEDRYSIYAHPKESISRSLIAPHVIAARAETSWEHLVRAERELLRAALQDPRNAKFVFLSETTVPLRSFEVVQQRLLETPQQLLLLGAQPTPAAWADVRPPAHAAANPRGQAAQAHPVGGAQSQALRSWWLTMKRCSTSPPATTTTTSTTSEPCSRCTGSCTRCCPLTPPMSAGSARARTAAIHLRLTTFERPPSGSCSTLPRGGGALFARKFAPACNLDPLRVYFPVHPVVRARAEEEAEYRRVALPRVESSAAQGDARAAIGLLEEFIARSPGCAEAQNDLAVLLRQAGRFSDALSCARRAAALDRESACIAGNLAALEVEAARRA